MTLRLTPLVDGPEAAETLVFLQGWPDDATLWDPQVAALSGRFRCVRTTLPNFDGTKTTRWGPSTAEIVDALVAMIEEAAPGEKVTLVAHDWGAYWAYRLYAQRPDLVRRFAALDIGAHVEASAKAAIGGVSYQGWLILAFLFGGPIGDWMTRSLAKLIGAPLDRAQINSGMNYPYRNAWRDIGRGEGMPESADEWPRGPVLFVYGKEKPFPFHSKEWLAHVERGGGTIVELPCGHWVSHDPGFQGVLDTWLDETSQGTSVTATEAS